MKNSKIKNYILFGLIATNLITAGAALILNINAGKKQVTQMPIEKEIFNVSEAMEIISQEEAPVAQGPRNNPKGNVLGQDKTIEELNQTIAEQAARLQAQNDRMNLLVEALAKTDLKRREEAAAKMLGIDMYGRLLNAYAFEHGFTNEEHNREFEIDKFMMATKFHLEDNARNLVNSGWNPHRLIKNKGATGKSYFDIGIGFESLPLNERTMIHLFSSPDRYHIVEDSTMSIYRDEYLRKIPGSINMNANNIIDFDNEF